MRNLGFFWRHSLAHLSCDKQRTLFVLFCIAAGVAAIVSLRTLGLMMQDALTRDLQAANRGDMVIGMPSEVTDDSRVTLPDGQAVPVDQILFEVQGDAQYGAQQTIWLSHSGQVRLEAWAATRNFDLQPLWSNFGPFTPLHKAGNNASADFVMVLGVDAARYPFYGSVMVLAPAGATLAQVLAAERDVTVTDNLARKLGLNLGDQIYLTGASGAFTVRGIVSPKSEASVTNLLGGSIFPFVYMPYPTALEAFRKKPATYYVKIPPGADVQAEQKEFLTLFPGLTATTYEDLRKMNAEFSDVLTRLVTVMGLVSLLIGGIGIANTMLVVVSRRTLEIAVLKTIGVQGSQIVLMFIIDALLLGLAGSLLGLALGQGLVLFLKNVGEQFVATSLRYTIYPEALGMGLGLGLVVTLVFGFLPTLAAGRVRPNTILHPQNASLPPEGRWLSLVVILALTASLGLIVGQIVGNTVTGLIVAYLTLIVLGGATFLLSLVVWLLGHLPSFNFISLKLSQRALNAHKGRAASTLLALVVGIFALGAIWLFVQGTLKLASAASAEQLLGGNILITVQTLADGRALQKKLARAPGVSRWVHDTKYGVEILAINGEEKDAAIARAKQRAREANVIGADVTIDDLANHFTLKVRADDTLPYQMAQGRDLALEASQGGADDLVLENSFYYGDTFKWFDLKPGDTLTLRFPSGAKRTATVAGITARRQGGGALLAAMVAFRETAAIIPPGLAPRNEEPVPSAYLLTVPDDRVNEVMDMLSTQPGVYMVDIRQFNVYTERFAEQFVPLPLIAAALALFASAIIIANSVALATLERRRQIGIMKAIGLQTETVLGLLLLENGMLGLTGGLLGAALSVLSIVGTNAVGDSTKNLPYGALGLLVALAVGLALAATLLTAWGASREKPLKVLRYE